MAFSKWIGGAIGFFAGGPLGAIAGYFLGKAVDNLLEGNDATAYQASAPDNTENSRGAFLFSLMVLSAHVIQADGKIMHSEMELVRRFLRQTFGPDAERQGNEILLGLFDYRKEKGDAEWNRQMLQVGQQLAQAMEEEARLQLIGFLVDIAKADGRFDQCEKEAIYAVAQAMHLSRATVDQMTALGSPSLDDAYAVLGISPSATDDEVRRAYKRVMVKYHPDRVAHLGEDVRQAATIKAQEINNAKEMIYAARGM